MFFSVIWRGICQALGWFFGLFGYKREGKFAKCVWGLFATSCTIIVTIFAGTLICFLYHEACREFRYYQNKSCYWSTYISRNITLYDNGDGKAWVEDDRTGEKTLTGIAWISKPLGEKDSLIVYSDGKKRGYFNMYTGRVALPATYNHAWVFSDGIAAIEENGIIKFINSKGHLAFDRTLEYDPNHDGYVFHGGYCIIDENNDKKYGLMNTLGVTIIPEEYSNIRVSCDLSYWTLSKDKESCVLDKDLNTILPLMECSLFVNAQGISVTMPDNTLRKYDLEGNLIDDFYITDFQYLEYDTEETYRIDPKKPSQYESEGEIICNVEHKKARARLCKYVAGNNAEGLMTPEGHMVTLPKYESVEAIGPDTYLCSFCNGNKEIINGKGHKVK